MDIYIYIMAGMFASFLMSMSLLLFYVRYRKNILQQQYMLKEAETKHQKSLLRAVIISQEKERSRIGMDLHDQVGATLSSLRLLIDSDRYDSTEINRRLKAQIDKVIDGVRHISHDLSPLIKGAYGFMDALSGFCDTVGSSGKINISLVFCDPAAETLLQGNTAIAMYRVLAELVNNTIRHAHAGNITIRCAYTDGVYTIDYTDDGIGLSAAVDMKGIGFQNIESRLEMIQAVYDIDRESKGFRMTIRLTI